MGIVLFDKMSDKFYFIPTTEETMRGELRKYLQENRELLEFNDNSTFDALLNNIVGAEDFKAIQELLLDVDMASALFTH